MKKIIIGWILKIVNYFKFSLFLIMDVSKWEKQIC